jgi:polyribonucleotide nucleotidyltransferase
MCNLFLQISHNVRFLQFSISIHRKMKLRSFRKKRNNIDSFVIAKESLKTRIKLTVKFLEDISTTITFAIFFSSQNSLQKSVKKSIKKSIKSVLSSQIKQSIKQSIKSIKKSIKKSIRKAFISFSNVNYFALLKISNDDDEIDDDLLTDMKLKNQLND